MSEQPAEERRGQDFDHDGESLDGVQLAILTSRLDTIVRTMINTIVRTGRSRIINTSRDCSCCILTRDSELLVTAESIPVHITSGPDIMTKSMKELHADLRRGDAYLHNSPYHGNSHPADHSILVPVIDDAGEHHFTVFSKAHQADCGNALPTTYAATARDVYEEGALIFPCVKVQDDYSDCEDILRMCELRIRVPEQWRGDHLALLGAARIGERRLLELAEEIGWETLHSYARQWFDYSEERMIETIRQLPSGRVTAKSAHDPMPGVTDGIPVNVAVEVKPDEAMIEVDLTENPDCQPCGLNLSEATARAAGIVGILNSIDHRVPANGGSFRRLKVNLRENCAVGIPRHPASCSAATTNLFDRVTNAVQRAMADLGEGIGLAEGGLSLPAALAVISGHDPRAGDAAFVNELMLPSGTGGPGGPETDGWLTFIHPANAGTALRDSVEIDEMSYPMLIYDQRIIPDSEGAGRFRGSPAAYIRYGPVGTSLEVVCASDGTVNPALGSRGGLSGAPVRQFRVGADGKACELDSFVHIVLDSGESIISSSCGGGGYGRAIDRDAERVRHDVIEGYVTRERAREVYGVVLDVTSEIDWNATRALRAELGAVANADVGLDEPGRVSGKN